MSAFLKVLLFSFSLSLLILNGWLTINRYDEAISPWLVYRSVGEIYRVRVDGKESRSLADNYPHGIGVKWTESGLLIWYISYGDGSSSIERITLNGKDMPIMGNGFCEEGRHLQSWFIGAWRVLRIQCADTIEVYRTNFTGTEVQRLNYFPFDAQYVEWSPDGEWLAFVAEDDGNREIYKMRADGTNIQNLSQHHGFDEGPQWSPDGEWIAFSSNRDGNRDLFRMRADGSGVQNITNDSAIDQGMGWSPDGKWIVFESNRTGNFEIYRMHPDGSEVQQLTNDPADDTYPIVSPDGNWIAFQSTRDPGENIYLMRIDGTDMVRLSHIAFEPSIPQWSPPLDLPYHTWGIVLVGLALAGTAVLYRRN